MGPMPETAPQPRTGEEPAPPPPDAPPQTPPRSSKDQEVEALKAQARAAEDQLRALTEKISQMETGTDSIPLVAVVDASLCMACGVCADVCPEGAIAVDDAAHIDASLCTGCGQCVAECPEEAITLKKR